MCLVLSKIEKGGSGGIVERKFVLLKIAFQKSFH